MSRYHVYTKVCGRRPDKVLDFQSEVDVRQRLAKSRMDMSPNRTQWKKKWKSRESGFSPQSRLRAEDLFLSGEEGATIAAGQLILHPGLHKG